ncbi:putative uncharacterized protein FLJ31958 isoform X2 [Suricata suricatta]|uniref:putative uncharacterized protein FLJ31958 isoform X2 n=1 Tax=Suricata suricatta TaxID=37032 RepID=UPI001155CB9F|nr:putative uncharacterized protein FLJ31958 isoform X2 [Suricata suricatta]
MLGIHSWRHPSSVFPAGEAASMEERRRAQARRVHLLLVAGAGGAVPQPEVLGGEEFWKDPDQEAGGEVAHGEALLHHLMRLLVRQQITSQIQAIQDEAVARKPDVY